MSVISLTQESAMSLNSPAIVFNTGFGFNNPEPK